MKMTNQILFSIAVAILLVGCSKPLTDSSGRQLPDVGQSAHLIEKHGWLALSESALGELMTPPKVDVQAVPISQLGAMLDGALKKNASRLLEEGKVIQFVPGSPVRILGYYVGDAGSIRLAGTQDAPVVWVKVEFLDGPNAGKSGFCTADGVSE
jgi:hypothetical protein